MISADEHWSSAVMRGKVSGTGGRNRDTAVHGDGGW
jgi:hypothetical protein